MDTNDHVPLVYPDVSGCSQLLLIDDSIQDPELMASYVNSETFSVIYSNSSTKTELLQLLRERFTTIDRIAIAFSSNQGTVKPFLNNSLFFTQNESIPYSENIEFMISLIKEFSVAHIDYLACNTLNYTIWTNYFTILTNETGVIVGASNDKTGNIKYGGDWILESTNQDIALLYFTQNIEYYKYVLDTPFISWVTTTTTAPLYLAGANSYIYILYDNRNISRMNPNGTVSLSPFNVGSTTTSWFSFAWMSPYFYLSTGSSALFYRLNTDGTVNSTNWSPSAPTTTSACSFVNDGTHLYISYFGSSKVVKFNLDGSVNNANWLTGITQPLTMLYLQPYIYVSFYASSAINVYSTSVTLIKANWATGLSGPVGIDTHENYIYVASQTSKK